jgi:hypothetical protein
MASAKSRFTPAFSSSRSFSRFGSLAPIPPYLAFNFEMVASLTTCLRHRSATETPFGIALEPLALPYLTMLLQRADDLILGEFSAVHLFIYVLFGWASVYRQQD